MFDILIQGGKIIDGTGCEAFNADVGVVDGKIVAVRPNLEGEAATTLDATGHTVMPGFVEVHSHFDGQATWDELLEPSTPHGVTTVVTGNCGVGFAPVRRGDESMLIELMEGVEDIPGTALYEGMTWGWESFPDYLDVLAARTWTADIATQIPHGPMRRFVMGDRSATGAAASEEELAALARLTREAVEAGAYGFTTSRTMGHLSIDGTPVPGTFAADDELFTLARAVRDGGGAIFEVAPAGLTSWDAAEIVAGEMEWICRMAAETGLTVSHEVLQQHEDPERWKREMSAARDWRARGARVFPLIAGRPFGILLGWELRHPFRTRPTYEALDSLSFDEKVEQLRKPDIKAAILSERGEEGTGVLDRFLKSAVPGCYALGTPPDYEPEPSSSLGELAAARGVSPDSLLYDCMLDEDGHGMLLFPVFNYAGGSHDVLYEQMQDPDAVLGLADAGAHCGAICDASMPTYLLTHWVRDRRRGARIGLEDAVRRLTSQPADLYGLSDRGRLEEGKRADINVVDLDALTLHAPYVAHDLPAGGLRILQGASGFHSTIVNGSITRRDDQYTGARPGRLLRNT
jgi:N-acyl-D-aspartate/D-glutamate deacylase